MEFISLTKLIDALAAGTALQIRIAFFSPHRSRLLRLPHRQLIHSAPFCAKQKENTETLSLCYRTREEKFQRARKEKAPFVSVCPFCVEEYLHPIFRRGNLFALIMISHPQGEAAREAFVKIAAAKAEILEQQILLLAQEAPKKREELDPITSQLTELLAEDYTRPLTVREFAQMLGYHEKYLGKQFKAQVGTGIPAYRNQLRLLKAEALLRNTNLTVIQIASQTGFDNVSYFNRLFRKKNHLTPTEYRKQNLS